MFSWYKYLIVSLIFPASVFGMEIVFLIAPPTCTFLSKYDFSTLYKTLPHNLVKEKLLDLIEWTFKRALKTMVYFIWPEMTERPFLLPVNKVGIHSWSCQNVCEAVSCLLDNIYIRFRTKLYSSTDKLLEFRWVHIAYLS